MNGATVVGLKPWLPGPLARSPWWAEPVPAERLAALRVGVGLVLLLDVLGTYLPRYTDFFGRGSLTAPGAGAGSGSVWEWHRTLLDPIASPTAWLVLLLLWATAALFLTVGLGPRGAAAVAWFLSVSVQTLNPALHNSGDQVRNSLLFFLILCPCGAVWCVGARRRHARETGLGEPVLIHPWALRLLFLQLEVIYFMNGLFKLRGEHWRDGDALVYLLGDAGWMRWSFAGWPLPEELLRIMTWTVLTWELGFPLFMFLSSLRKPTLLLGVLFHVGTGLTMRLGPFPLYMLCLYLPLLPWERWRTRAAAGITAPAASAAQADLLGRELRPMFAESLTGQEM